MGTSSCLLFVITASLLGCSQAAAGLQRHQVLDIGADDLPHISPPISADELLEAGSLARRRLLEIANQPEPFAGVFCKLACLHYHCTCPACGTAACILSPAPWHCTERRRVIGARCRLARGDWCGKFERQAPTAWQPAPQGDKQCPKTAKGICNGVGNCNYDTGMCDCPAGGWGVLPVMPLGHCHCLLLPFLDCHRTSVPHRLDWHTTWRTIWHVRYRRFSRHNTDTEVQIGANIHLLLQAGRGRIVPRL